MKETTWSHWYHLIHPISPSLARVQPQLQHGHVRRTFAGQLRGKQHAAAVGVSCQFQLPKEHPTISICFHQVITSPGIFPQVCGQTVKFCNKPNTATLDQNNRSWYFHGSKSKSPWSIRNASIKSNMICLISWIISINYQRYQRYRIWSFEYHFDLVNSCDQRYPRDWWLERICAVCARPTWEVPGNSNAAVTTLLVWPRKKALAWHWTN